MDNLDFLKVVYRPLVIFDTPMSILPCSPLNHEAVIYHDFTLFVGLSFMHDVYITLLHICFPPIFCERNPIW